VSFLNTDDPDPIRKVYPSRHLDSKGRAVFLDVFLSERIFRLEAEQRLYLFLCCNLLANVFFLGYDSSAYVLLISATVNPITARIVEKQLDARSADVTSARVVGRIQPFRVAIESFMICFVVRSA